ncbi:hypothetical protein [Shewanella frigidimarina]|uniref:Restriction endonuclease n=1 Tax=Shewanella frigidimarina TaxID=56812 RepID=A0A106C2V7_SHEFR|nr:hypothetical protein [Shewanella frigidimarina]KVX03222.1 hypothetical protein AWJ07_01220 [Shewanella frigidimarina]
MKVPTESYNQISHNYSNALIWMRDIGVNIGSGRTQHYQKVLENWKGKYKTATLDEENSVFPNFVSSVFEIHDFVQIYKAFHDVPKSELIHIAAKLQKGVNGPINAVEETAKSTTARNFLFEASFAARAHRPNVNVEAILDAETDTGINIDKKKLWVECKRVTSIDKIETNVRKACKQLESIIKKKIGSGHRGIVALDVTKLISPGDEIFVSDNDSELMASVDRMMDQFILEHSKIWQELYNRKSKKIIGTIVRFAFMSTSESRNLLVYTSQWGVNPRLGISASDEEIQRVLAHSLKDIL